MATTKQLDEIADRLGALYQSIGRISPEEVDQGTWADAMDELVNIRYSGANATSDFLTGGRS